MATNPATTPDTASARKPQRLRLGDLLVQQRVISSEQLTQTLEAQRTTGKKLGRLLIENGIITEDILGDALAKQLRIPFVNLKFFTVRPEVVKLLPESMARRFRALVLENRKDSLLVALADPLDLFAYDELARVLKRDVALAVVPESQILAAFDRFYRRTEEISGLAKALEQDIGDAVDFGTLSATAGQEEAPVVRLLQTVFEDATQVRASDIHVEPQEDAVQIRFRIDGMLMPQTRADKRIASALAQRLKLMAGLDISERRLPQDGRFAVRVREQVIDVRMSTLPSQHGESVVLRLLNLGGAAPSLDRIGMPPAMLERFRAILGRVSGMVLVTGPTGSGKTTTLYAALAEIDATSQKIITVEDPVEYRLPGITQVQVNEKIELSFARILRACLRQDPDVILVGEMRDSETANIGLRAAITGHMVLSTVHTRDAISTPFRLLDMGVPPFMVSTSLQAVIAQRLVRLNCESCTEPSAATPQEQAWLDAMGGVNMADVTFTAGRGCSACNGTGYNGRTGVYEMLEMTEELTRIAGSADPALFLEAARAHMAGRTFVHHALEIARAGKTSIAEVMSISNQSDS